MSATSPRTAPILDALPHLPATTEALPGVLGIQDSTLHTELRLHDGQWHVLDIGVRPGSGLVAHSVQARHRGRPTAAAPARPHQPARRDRPHPSRDRHSPRHGDCLRIHRRDPTPEITLRRQADLAATLANDPDVIGWHLKTSTTDEVHLPDAGLSVGIGASDTRTGLARLRSTTKPFHYVTT